METNSRDERVMLNDIHRIAKALERLADVAEKVARTVPAPKPMRGHNAQDDIAVEP